MFQIDSLLNVDNEMFINVRFNSLLALLDPSGIGKRIKIVICDIFLEVDCAYLPICVNKVLANASFELHFYFHRLKQN